MTFEDIIRAVCFYDKIILKLESNLLNIILDNVQFLFKYIRFKIIQRKKNTNII